jgi:hypothetical protein
MGRRLPSAVAAAAVLTLAAWAFFPVVLLVIHAAQVHATWTGADGLIGADGVLGADQLQYLAWGRSIAQHGLASDLFTLGSSGHVFLEPASGLEGGFAAAGAGLITGYLVVKALGVLVLAGGVLAWCRRLLGGRDRSTAAAVALALFTVTPATTLVNWLALGPPRFRFDVYLAGDELLAATKLWGYVPAALAIGLMCVALLALERALPGGKRRALVLALAASLLCAWLHPWQGITLVFILLGLAVWRRRRGELPALALGVLALALPLAYYGLLAHADPAWRMASHNEQGPRLPATVLLACLAPLVILALPGLRRVRRQDALAEQALVLWVPAGLATYWVNGAFATHALQGLMVPLAVLLVRGALRVRLPAEREPGRLRPLIAGACVVALTLPGLAYAARKFVRTSRSGLVQYALPAADRAALRWVSARAPVGGVLAPTPFATVVPAQTGRAVWVGHGDWSPDYPVRARRVDRLFSGRMRPAGARAFVRGTGARVLVLDCAHRSRAAHLQRALAPLIARSRRFGCARVDVLRGR